MENPRTHQLEHSNTILEMVHTQEQCAGRPCTIHNRTEHHMRSFPQHWRSDRQIMERICPHGIGHPDPDSPWAHDSHEWIHGCDGCCLDEDILALTSATDRRKRSPVGTVYNEPEKIFPVADDVVKRLRSIPTAKLANVAADKIEYLQVENDEQNEDIIRLLTEIGRLRAAGDGLVAVISNCECVTGERCGWCIAKDKWGEARRG